jgi:hypothetical protein
MESMKSFLSARALVVMAIVGSAFMACGGSIEQGSDGSSGGGGSGKSSGGGSSGGSSSGGSSSGGSSGGGANSDAGIGSSDGGGGGNTCVDIDTTNFDTSCHVDNDCMEITTGYLCGADNCFCGGSTINVDGESQYDDLTYSLPPQEGVCGCPFFGTPTCAQGTCTICPPPGSGESGPAGCPDAG